MNTIKVNDTRFGKLGRLLVKFLRYGKSDVQEYEEVSPFGIDSRPIDKTTGVCDSVPTNGKLVVLGYFNENRKSDKGDVRLFAIDANAAEKMYIWLKNNGTLELAGDSDNAVRYSKLDTALSNFKTQMQSELTLIQTGITSAGGSYTPSALQLDISQSKINEIKVP